MKKIHDAGGIAVLAHPFRTFYHNEELLEKAIESGIWPKTIWNTNLGADS